MSLTDLYIERAHRHNAALVDGDKYAQEAANQQGQGILACIRELYGSAAAGRAIMAADNAVMEQYPDEPMCGGMLLGIPSTGGAS